MISTTICGFKLGVNLISNTKIVSSFLRRKNQIASLTFAFETLLTSKSDYVMPRPDEKTEVPWSIFSTNGNHVLAIDMGRKQVLT